MADTSAPSAPTDYYELFKRALTAVLARWHPLRACVSAGCAPRNYRELFGNLVDELLDNFEERWEKAEQVDVPEIAEFLQEFVLEEFMLEAEHAVCAEVAHVLERLYSTCVVRDDRTAARILARDHTEFLEFWGLTEDAPPPLEQHSDGDDEDTGDDEGGPSGRNADDGESEPDKDADASAPESDSGPDPDGWSTATSRRRR